MSKAGRGAGVCAFLVISPGEVPGPNRSYKRVYILLPIPSLEHLMVDFSMDPNPGCPALLPCLTLDLRAWSGPWPGCVPPLQPEPSLH